ncbi:MULTISPECIES: hypothetical protein [Dehalobacter]|jgi:hypothetical protein|uniref:Uncharacterized protein n=2 Tax=Dehalobacter restrictus TaxID=55583 RepID=A0A857DHG9_9FIRM|nr:MULTISPECIES: hypothetical protein [Dehalobacter]AHF09136.1 hypothetical protein DEHRE_02705 [Dehalobacter restrictus DSM 9455]MCG1024408.1 hypothetical protein [Dehalobacter sp.]MDJ0306876.1 hypothetical protein [Dehalobacter sp.]QGZ99675.1 hypothetical protein GQ588_02920 [Dehalobacter restrictus]
MRISKKAALPLVFTVGILLFATTALADIVSKSGYDTLKDGLKQSAASCSEKFNNFTLDYSFAIKYNGEIISSQNDVKKFDRLNGATEDSSHSLSQDGKVSDSYYYTDKNTWINGTDIGTSNEAYYYTEYTQERETDVFDNPFKQDEAEDVEKIVDAVVGSLKDHVVVQENADGSKGLSGSLSEVQIPALVNAVASLQVKQAFSGQNSYRARIPVLTQDIYVKQIEGSATVNSDGLLDYILATVILSGKDAQEQVHEITMETLVKLTDINETVVQKPDLSGKEVQRTTERNSAGPQISNPEKFIGTFKNDIIIEQDGKFIKIGERILQIAHVESANIAGKYSEEYREGFETYAQNALAFTFDATTSNQAKSDAMFEFRDNDGSNRSGSIYLDEANAKVYFNLNMSNGSYDSVFSPVLE